MNDTYQDVVTIFPPEQSREGGTVLLQFQTRGGETHQIRMKANIARYLGSQLQLNLLLLPEEQMGHPANEPYPDVVAIFPPEKSPDGGSVLLKFQTQSSETIRLRVSTDIARNLGTQLVLLSARPSASGDH